MRTPFSNSKIDRKNLSMIQPAGWAEVTTIRGYDPDSFVIFQEAESNCLFEVLIVKKSAGAVPGQLLMTQKEGWLRTVSDANVELFDRWGSYFGQGYDMEGKIASLHLQRHRVFLFSEGDNVCIIVESAPSANFLAHEDDFKTIRDSFKLK
jgi:hypothetical protein